MDIDVEEHDFPVIPKFSLNRRSTLVVIDDAHPFDLETYISSYTGRTVVDRLIHIIQSCPSIAPQALQNAIEHVQQLRDVSLYNQLLAAYDQAHAAAGAENPIQSRQEIHDYDQRWVEETNRKNAEEKAKLEVELKTYTSNMIKESIRMAHRDLAEYYRSVGDYQTSMKHYTKIREFCTTSQHVLDMCLAILELQLEQRSYAHIPTYVYKAEPALDATTNSLRASNQGPTATAPPPGRERIASEREKVQSKLDLANALAQMGQGVYDKAAQTFLKIGSIKSLGDWAHKVAAPSDIAVYGMLCALATYPRTAIKSQVLDNDGFSVFIEQEPYVRELVEAYMASKFSTVLELLDRYQPRHLLDIYFGPHVTNVINLIKNRALVLYFQPFASIRMERMSQAFGWTVEQLEEAVVGLIQSGEIQARVDKQNKILKAKQTDQRAQLFARAMKSGENMVAANRKLLLRMQLQQADLVVKAPKNTQQQPLTAHTTEPAIA